MIVEEGPLAVPTEPNVGLGTSEGTIWDLKKRYWTIKAPFEFGDSIYLVVRSSILHCIERLLGIIYPLQKSTT